MSGKIERYDLITKEAIDEVSKLLTKFEGLIDSAKDLSIALKGSGTSLENTAKNAQKSTKNTQQLTEAQKELAKQVEFLGRISKQRSAEYMKELELNAKAAKKVADEEKKKNAEMQKSKTALDAQRTKAYTKELELYAKAAKKVADEEKKKNAEMQKSKTALDAQRTKAYNQELKQQEKLTKLLIAAKNTEAGSLTRLNALNNIYKQRMSQLNVLIPEQAKTYEFLNRKIIMNQQAMSKMAMAKQGLLSSFGKLIRSVGVYGASLFGLNKIVNFFTKDLLDLTKKLDSLDFSFKTVIKSAQEQEQTLIFLDDVAQNYGQDIVALTERYIKFRAAAQQSNISARDTQKIFNSAAKAASVLGLRTDELNGIFLALEQMLSKGKVTTEELRRQLGERLPGAFGIMADAIGVSLIELDKMLKAGDVLSAEALPKFAIALENAYGIESLNKVDTLAAAQGRLKNSWVAFVDALEASNVYKGTINFLNDLINYSQVAFGYSKRMLDIYLDISDKSGDAARNLVLEFDKINFKAFNSNIKQYRDIWVDALRETGVRTKDAIHMFELYIDRKNKLLLEDSAKAKKTQLFDLDEFKSILDNAENEFDIFTSTQEGEIKNLMEQNAAFYKQDQTTYKEYLSNKLSELKENIRLSEGSYKVYQAQIDSQKLSGKELTKEESQELQVRLQNFQNYLSAYGIVSKELQDLQKGGSKKGSTKDDSLATAKKNNELIIAILENALQKQAEIDGESKSKELERETLLFDTKKQLNDELLQYVKVGSKEYYDILATSYDLQTQLAQKKATILGKIDDDFLKSNQNIFKKWDDERKAQDEQTIADLYAGINEQRVIMAEAATQQLKDEGTNNRKKQEINKKLLLAQLQFERERLQELIDSGQLLVENEQKISDQVLQIKEAEERAKRELQEETRRQQEENLQYLGQAVSNGASLYSEILEGQLAKAKQIYEADAAAAGDSAEKKYLAELKYQEEQRKIKRRQAIADKAQALFNIGLQLAMAEAELNPFQIAAAILAAATVIAKPIPEFATGTDFAPETFIAGEKGTEAIVKKTGETLLTPDKATMFSDKSFIGAKIIPNDETQKLLANQALRQSAGIVDMGRTNKHLSNIERNTKRDKEIFTRNGKVMMKRGIVTSVIS